MSSAQQQEQLDMSHGRGGWSAIQPSWPRIRMRSPCVEGGDLLVLDVPDSENRDYEVQPGSHASDDVVAVDAVHVVDDRLHGVVPGFDHGENVPGS